MTKFKTGLFGGDRSATSPYMKVGKYADDKEYDNYALKMALQA